MCCWTRIIAPTFFIVKGFLNFRENLSKNPYVTTYTRIFIEEPKNKEVISKGILGGGSSVKGEKSEQKQGSFFTKFGQGVKQRSKTVTFSNTIIKDES